MAHLWADSSLPWYAALVDEQHRVYGIARRTRYGGDLRFDAYDRVGDTWRPAAEGVAYFTEGGGVTDAVPIPPEAVDGLKARLRGLPVELDRFLWRPGDVRVTPAAGRRA